MRRQSLRRPNMFSIGGAVGRAFCRRAVRPFGCVLRGCRERSRARAARHGSGCCHSRGRRAVRALRQRRQHHCRAPVIAHLAFGEQQQERAALPVADRVQLRVQAAFGAPDTARNSPFCSRLAAVRWAFRWVASIIRRCGRSDAPASAAKMRANTPRRLQRTNRFTASCAGRSRAVRPSTAAHGGSRR